MLPKHSRADRDAIKRVEFEATEHDGAEAAVLTPVPAALGASIQAGDRDDDPIPRGRCAGLGLDDKSVAEFGNERDEAD